MQYQDRRIGRFAEVTHVGVQRLAAGDAQEYSAQHQEPERGPDFTRNAMAYADPRRQYDGMLGQSTRSRAAQ